MTVEVQVNGSAVEVAVAGQGTPGLSAYQLAVLHGYDGTEQQYAAAQNILTGTTTPNAGTGVEGNYYLNTVTGDFYHKSDGVWTLAGNLRGPSGGPVPSGGAVNQIIRKSGTAEAAVEWTSNVYVSTDAVGFGTSTPGAPLHFRRGENNVILSDDGVFKIKTIGDGWIYGGYMLRAGWEPVWGDYLYLSCSGNQPPETGPALDLSRERGILFGLGSESGDSLSAEHVRLTPTGHLSIGSSSPYARLYVQGFGTTSSTSSVRITDSAGTALLSIRDDGAFAFKGGTVGLAQAGYIVLNVTADRTFNVFTTTVHDLANVLGTLINDLKGKGIIAG